MEITRQYILQSLREDDPQRLAELWQAADKVRRESVGDQVHLRGLVEFSNHCVRSCGYCGLRLGNEVVARYRMTPDGILACAHQAVRFGYGTVVLQSGEDEETSAEWMASVVRRVKSETPLAVTLSLGERSEEDLACWRKAGADRYLLRFETSNRDLFDKIHPSLPGQRCDRIGILHQLRKLGYEVGSGVMIGIPGQTYDDLTNDIELFRQLRLDMIGVGPYLPHPATPLGQFGDQLAAAPGEQVPNSEEMTYKVVALARLVCPKANIPSTTALATINKEQGRELGLQRGANVVMPNLTPLEYRRLYEIYPSKACIQERAEDCHHCLSHRIAAIGRAVGSGRGDSASYQHRETTTDPG